jgi:hypothetical protein
MNKKTTIVLALAILLSITNENVMAVHFNRGERAEVFDVSKSGSV